MERDIIMGVKVILILIFSNFLLNAKIQIVKIKRKINKIFHQ